MASFDQKLDELGRSIQDIVDRAVNSRDYQTLNQTIRQTVGRAVDMGSETVRKVMENGAAPAQTGHQEARNIYGSTLGKTVKGVLKAAVGAPIALFGALAFLGNTVLGEPYWRSPAAVIFSLLLTGGGGWLLYSGVRTLGMVKRFKVYRRTLGQKTYCALEELARYAGRSEAFVRRDIQKMIGQGFFLQGHMDQEQTSLIVSDETYRHYRQSMRAYAEKQETAARQQTEASAHKPEVQEVLDRGNAFIAQIRKCNDDIPGEEISRKIDHMENIVRRIFQRAEEHPEIVPDLKKLMDYYLPMTVKLLDAYADMDAQPIQGETIAASKREIEGTLDTLNLAFEKLLDSIFKDTALDVSSDISVLNTLLAQEGLTQDDFSPM